MTAISKRISESMLTAVRSLDLDINFEEDNYDAGVANGFFQGAFWMLNNVWTHTDDDFPEDGALVVTKYTTNFNKHIYTICRYSNEEGFIRVDTCKPFEFVDYWMQIPD